MNLSSPGEMAGGVLPLPPLSPPRDLVHSHQPGAKGTDVDNTEQEPEETRTAAAACVASADAGADTVTELFDQPCSPPGAAADAEADAKRKGLRKKVTGALRRIQMHPEASKLDNLLEHDTGSQSLLGDGGGSVSIISKQRLTEKFNASMKSFLSNMTPKISSPKVPKSSDHRQNQRTATINNNAQVSMPADLDVSDEDSLSGSRPVGDGGESASIQWRRERRQKKKRKSQGTKNPPNSRLRRRRQQYRRVPSNKSATMVNDDTTNTSSTTNSTKPKPPKSKARLALRSSKHTKTSVATAEEKTDKNVPLGSQEGILENLLCDIRAQKTASGELLIKTDDNCEIDLGGDAGEKCNEGTQKKSIKKHTRRGLLTRDKKTEPPLPGLEDGLPILSNYPSSESEVKGCLIVGSEADQERKVATSNVLSSTESTNTSEGNQQDKNKDKRHPSSADASMDKQETKSGADLLQEKTFQETFLLLGGEDSSGSKKINFVVSKKESSKEQADDSTGVTPDSVFSLSNVLVIGKQGKTPTASISMDDSVISDFKSQEMREQTENVRRRRRRSCSDMAEEPADTNYEKTTFLAGKPLDDNAFWLKLLQDLASPSNELDPKSQTRPVSAKKESTLNQEIDEQREGRIFGKARGEDSAERVSRRGRSRSSRKSMTKHKSDSKECLNDRMPKRETRKQHALREQSDNQSGTQSRSRSKSTSRHERSRSLRNRQNLNKDSNHAAEKRQTEPTNSTSAKTAFDGKKSSTVAPEKIRSNSQESQRRHRSPSERKHRERSQSKSKSNRGHRSSSRRSAKSRSVQLNRSEGQIKYHPTSNRERGTRKGRYGIPKAEIEPREHSIRSRKKDVDEKVDSTQASSEQRSHHRETGQQKLNTSQSRKPSDKGKRRSSTEKRRRGNERMHKSEGVLNYDNRGTNSDKGKHERRSDCKLESITKRWNLSGDFDAGESLRQARDENGDQSRGIERAHESQAIVNRANEEVRKIRNSKHRSKRSRNSTKDCTKEVKEAEPTNQEKKSRGKSSRSRKSQRGSSHDHSTRHRSKDKKPLRHQEAKNKSDHSRKSKSERLQRTSVAVQ